MAKGDWVRWFCPEIKFTTPCMDFVPPTSQSMLPSRLYRMNQHSEKIASFPGLFRFQEIFTLQFQFHQFRLHKVALIVSDDDVINEWHLEVAVVISVHPLHVSATMSWILSQNNAVSLTGLSFVHGGSLCLLSRKGPSVLTSLLALLFLFIDIPFKFTLNNLTENLRQLQFGQTNRCVSTNLSPSFSNFLEETSFLFSFII